MVLRFFIAVMAAGWVCLNAAEPPVVVGFDIFSSRPLGTLREDFTRSSGQGVSVFADWDLGRGHGVRWDILRLTGFPSKTNFVDGKSLDSKLTGAATFLSYVYHLDVRDRGPYISVGLGLRSLSGRTEASGGNPKQSLGGRAMDSYTEYVAGTGGKFAFQVGVGYEFTNHLGVSLQYQGMQSMGHTLATLDGGISVRF